MELCAECGGFAEIIIWPDTRNISYVVDCINTEHVRDLTTEPHYITRNEAIAGWNAEQLSE